MPNFKYIKTLSVHPKIQSDLEYDHNLIKHDSALSSGKVPTVFSIPVQQTVLTEFTLYLFRIFYKAKIIIHTVIICCIRFHPLMYFMSYIKLQSLMVLLKPNGLGQSPIRGADRDANVCW